MSLDSDYRIEVAPAAGLIRMIFIGFWDTATATAFAQELDVAMDRLAKAGIRPGEFLYLADFRQSVIQSPAMVERFQGFATNAGTRARRVAVLCVSTLQKMQAQRMAATCSHFRFFLESEEIAAEGWLQADHVE